MPTFFSGLQFIFDIGVALVLAIPLILYPFLYFYQERLLFFPRPMAMEAKQMLQARSPKGEVRLTGSDGVSLHGWVMNLPASGQVPLLIYWGGNAEEISGFLLENATRFPDWAVMAVNYRGYGESKGKPGERQLIEDALLIFDWARQLPGIDPGRMVVMGRSLGTGVAVQVAAQRQVAGVCLVSPYDSIQRVAQGVYPWVPVKWLLKHPFDSLAHAPKIRAPLLTLMASEDTVIPLHHSNRLIDHWGGPHQEKVFPGEDHNSIGMAPGYHDAIRDFLAALSVVES